MAFLKSKYQREESELVKSMIRKGKRTFISEIRLVETSKLEDHQIYDCVYIDSGTKKQIHIIATDVNDVVAKLEGVVDCGVPEAAANIMLGSEKYNHGE
jgi:hypothetical protein